MTTRSRHHDTNRKRLDLGRSLCGTSSRHYHNFDLTVIAAYVKKKLKKIRNHEFMTTTIAVPDEQFFSFLAREN
jgi:hypothetical protein